MARHDFTLLLQQYPATIAQMPTRFTAHKFVNELGRRNQGPYFAAMATYGNIHPAQTVHQVLAAFLKRFPNLVVRDGDEPHSRDLWGNSNGCSRWRRIGSPQE